MTNDATSAAGEPLHPAPLRPAKWKLTLVVGGVLAIQIGNYIASASMFALIDRHPLWLVLLQPTTKNLLIVAEQISLITFLVVAILRRQLPHPLWFLIGRWYGQSGIEWVKKRFPEFGSIIVACEDAFPKWGPIICLVYPHPAICTMAGASKMKFRWFLVYTFIGIIGYVCAARAFGDWLSPVTGWITRFGHHYLIPLTVLTVAITAFSIWRAFRADKLESINKMEDELDQGSSD